MLDYEILKQALKENEEQENEAEQLKREQLAYKREALAYKREQLEQKKRQQARQQEPTRAKGSGAVVASLVVSFLSFAIMAIFYIVLLLKY